MSSESPAPPRAAEELAALVPVSRETLLRFDAYADLLRKWQKRINLVSNDTMPDLWRRHFLDSVQLVSHLPPGIRTLTDFGSGAGFPGLVLAIATGLETHLIESDTRKCAFLREAVRLVGAHVTVHTERVEKIDPWPTDAIVARALAPLEKLFDYAQKFQTKEGNRPVYLFLKGKNASHELTEAQKKWNMQVERFPSLSDSMGSILRFSAVTRRESHD